MTDYLTAHPEIHTIRVAACDLNGQPRGKRMPVSSASKLDEGSLRFPMSVLNLDMWGEDIEDSPLVFAAGDPDGTLYPTERGFVPMPWLQAPSALMPIWMSHDDGTPFAGDPRHALAQVLDRYTARGWTPVVATELEFYLIDDSGDTLRVPASPRSGKRRLGSDTLSLRTLDAFDTFFTELYDACAAMDIPADAAISECGWGQFEINLLHQNDALKAADDTWLFKMLTHGLARKHGFAASFMAKPYPDYAGNGMHTHFSVLDAQGNNVFDDGTARGSDTLLAAVAGCLRAIPDSGLIFAPHGNSYDRMVPGAHAPTSICWAYENRTAAVRVPGGSPKARRIEHRVAGGDINPYLMLAAVLGAALTGVEDNLTPPDPITGNAYDLDLPQMPTTWADAISSFENSALMPRILPPDLIRNLVLTKKQERAKYANLGLDDQIALYLDTV